MQASDVQKLILDQLDNVDVNVETDGHHYQVTAIGDMFEGLNAVKRQQVIYGCLNSNIADGTIHAVVIKTFTKNEWAARS